MRRRFIALDSTTSSSDVNGLYISNIAVVGIVGDIGGKSQDMTTSSDMALSAGVEDQSQGHSKGPRRTLGSL